MWRDILGIRIRVRRIVYINRILLAEKEEPLQPIEQILRLWLLFDDSKIKIARKLTKKQKENPVGCTGEGKIWKGNIREESGEDKNRLGVEFGGEVTLERLALTFKRSQVWMFECVWISTRLNTRITFILICLQANSSGLYSIERNSYFPSVNYIMNNKYKKKHAIKTCSLFKLLHIK